MRTLLTDLGFQQENPTKLFIDNTGAVFMVDAQAPTKRTRHVDIRYFALLQWSDSGQLKAEAITTEENISDSMTKALGRTKFHQQADIYMGRTPPSYVTMPTTGTASISTFHLVPIHLETLSALHHQLYSAYAYILHSTDLQAQSMGG
jgi:hypothetical protein